MYVGSSKGYLDVEPEIVNWRTGGMFKAIMSGGILGGHVNGWINLPTSPLAVPPTVELLVITPEGTAASEYQLLKLDSKDTRREFRAMSTSVAGARSGTERNQITFQGERLQPRTYRIQLKDLRSGEYGLLPPFAANSSAGAVGKIYSFTVK